MQGNNGILYVFNDSLAEGAGKAGGMCILDADGPWLQPVRTGGDFVWQ